MFIIVEVAQLDQMNIFAKLLLDTMSHVSLLNPITGEGDANLHHPRYFL